MKLSIIIVNFNVKYFLEQCLISVEKAAEGISNEIFVVDNHSVDGSNEMVRDRFPGVHLIANENNPGFAVANNQAIRMAKGEYVLLLNPDTVVQENTFTEIIRFMDAHADAGALGVQMIDGKGKFLPESKRGLPSPAVAFYKIFGLSALFPKSKTFGRYHLGYLDRNQTSEADVLSGAFMLIRKSVLDKTGLLDESFFMYGEDIDLSYRIVKAGYKNYYFPGTRIIHYKGESTKKSSVNYVIVFYKAMKLFAEKHYSQKNARTFSMLINLAIYLRAAFALLSRILEKIFLPLLDAGFIYTSMFFLKSYWETSVKELHYPTEFMTIAVPLYVLAWVAGIYVGGGYDRPIRLSKIIRGILTSTVLILVVYALLSEEYRFSRALILLGAASACTITVLTRLLLKATGIKLFELENSSRKRIIIAAGEEEGKRILSLLQLTGANSDFIGFVEPSESSNRQPEYSNFALGKFSRLQEITEVFAVNEVIFSAHDVSSHAIIDQMLAGKTNIEYKIAPPESMSIIGSNSIDRQGELYFIDLSTINNPVNRRNKRIFDIVLCLVLLVTLPFNIWLVQHKGTYLKNIFSVLFAGKNWVGIQPPQTSVLNPSHGLNKPVADETTINRLNMLYAREYKIMNDWQIVKKGFRYLGNA